MTDINDLLHGEAVRQAKKYGNFEPLYQLFLEGNPATLRDKHARELLVKKARCEGKSLLGRGQKHADPYKETRNERIVKTIYLLIGYGYPERTSENWKGSAIDACMVASEKFGLDTDHIYREIWKKRGPDKATWIVWAQIGKDRKEGGHEIDDLLPSP